MIFVEDPGAANCISQLPAALAEQGRSVRLLADGYAKEHLFHLGVRSEVVPHSKDAEEILASIAPRLLVVGTARNPETLGLALVAEARSFSIKSVGIVDALINADRRFCGRSDDPLAYAPDWLLVADKWTKDVYTSLGYPAQRVAVCGHPHYDYVLSIKKRLEQDGRNVVRQRVLQGVSERRKVVIFATEGSARLTQLQSGCSAEYTLTGRGASTGRTEVVLEEFLDAVQLVEPRPYLVLRLHPKDTQDDYTAYLDEFDLISSGGSPLELIYVADLVVGLTTMLILEAALLGKPTLSVVPRALEKEWLPSVRAGITPCAATRKQLRAALVDLLCDSSHMPCANVDDVIPFGSLQRIMDFIERLLEWAKTN